MENTNREKYVIIGPPAAATIAGDSSARRKILTEKSNCVTGDSDLQRFNRPSAYCVYSGYNDWQRSNSPPAERLSGHQLQQLSEVTHLQERGTVGERD